MPRYRKRPVVVDAFRLGYDSLPEWFFSALRGGYASDTSMAEERLGFKISTPEGDVTVHRGDWVIRGVVGELYPCRSDVFKATYEEVRDE